ncbi:MAG: hypothetical protein ABSC53_06515 [Bacteroidota bacterium]
MGKDLTPGDYLEKYTSTSLGEEVNQGPNIYELFQNYPNSFNPITTIKFTLGDDCYVLLKVYDVLCRKVATLINQDLKEGEPHSAIFNATMFAADMYYILGMPLDEIPRN